MKEKENERQWQIKNRELALRERKWEARTRRDSEMLAMMQQHFKEQQEWQKQTQEQNKSMLEESYLIRSFRYSYF